MDSNPEILGNVPTELKEQRWQNLTLLVEQINDGLGKGIDSGIKEAILGLNANNINTVQSCEGHLDWGTGAPWVDIEAPYLDELQRQLHDAYQAVDLRENQHASPEEIERVYEQIDKLNGQITRENLKERQKIMDLLQLFYENRPVPYERQLSMQDHGLGRTRIESIGAAMQQIAETPMKQQKLQEYQNEMSAFARFLKDKFYQL